MPSARFRPEGKAVIVEPEGSKNKPTRWNFRSVRRWLPEWESVETLLYVAFVLCLLPAVCQMVTGWPSWGFWGFVGLAAIIGIPIGVFVLLGGAVLLVGLVCFLPFIVWADARLLMATLRSSNHVTGSDAGDLLSETRGQSAGSIVFRWLAMPIASLSALAVAAFIRRRALWPPFDYGRFKDDEGAWLSVLVTGALGGVAFVMAVGRIAPHSKGASRAAMSLVWSALVVVGIPVVWLLWEASGETRWTRTCFLLGSAIAAIRIAAYLEERDARH